MAWYKTDRTKQISVRLRTWVLVLVAWLVLWWAVPGRQAYAHGGAVIASGFTETYEWLVAVDPYPTTPGTTVITLLIFDLQTYQPVLDLQEPQLYLTPPDGAAQSEFFPLETDPAIYPGDYSAVVVLDQTGDWQASFVAAGDAPLELTATIRVFPGTGGETVAPDGPPNAVATATVFAQNVAAARGVAGTPIAPDQFSSLLSSASVSPLVVQLSSTSTGTESTATLSRPSNPFGNTWWLWGALGLIPITALFVWALRPYQEDES